MRLAEIPLAPVNVGFRGYGPLGLENENLYTAPTIFTKVISSIIGVLTVVGAIWFVILFMTGALAYLSSGGDKAKVESARSKIITGAIGLVIIVAGLFLVDLVGSFIGFDILDIKTLIDNIIAS